MAGVGEATLEALRHKLVEFVRSACGAGSVPYDVFEESAAAVGDRGVVEVVALNCSTPISPS